MSEQTSETRMTQVSDLAQIKSATARATTAELITSLRQTLEETIPGLLEKCEDELDDLEDALEDEDS